MSGWAASAASLDLSSQKSRGKEAKRGSATWLRLRRKPIRQDRN